MKTKILFTIGPCSQNPKIFEEIVSLADCVRINTAHGTPEEHAEMIKFIRKMSHFTLPIMLDIKGPELRIMLENPLELKAGEIFELGFGNKNCFTYNFSKEVKKGERIFFDDGKLEAKIISVSAKNIVMQAKNQYLLKNKKNVCIPKKNLKIPQLSQNDLKEIALANKEKIEYVALSFVRTKKDVENLRKKLFGEIGIIAKIENAVGLRNIDEIIEAADGIMVARGDLAVDIGQEKVPLAQKEIIRKCNEHGKLAITATQVLETMIENPYPTRAEVSDIANTVLDGSDAIMLSGETAIGKYPVKAIKIIGSVAKEVEGNAICNINLKTYSNISDAISKSIYTLATVMPLDAIVSITRSGYTAKMISRFRLKNRIIAITQSRSVEKQLKLYSGIESVFMDEIPQVHIIPMVASLLISKNLIKKSDTVLFTAGIRTKEKHASNLIEIHKIGELLT